jgi:hypothetical protein
MQDFLFPPFCNANRSFILDARASVGRRPLRPAAVETVMVNLQ